MNPLHPKSYAWNRRRITTACRVLSLVALVVAAKIIWRE